MADFDLTPALVKPSAKGLSKRLIGISGAAITPGMPVYRDSASKLIKISDANGSPDEARVDGIAVTGSSEGQPVIYIPEDDDFDLGVAIGSGQIVVLSASSGKLAPDEDAETGWVKTFVGIGIGGTKIALRPLKGGSV